MNTDTPAEFYKIVSILPDFAKEKLNIVSQAIYKKLLVEKEVDTSKLVQAELGGQFADLSEPQVNILTFYLLVSVHKLLLPTNLKTGSIDDMSEQDMSVLQQSMEQKSQLEQMISNYMKAGFEEGLAAISTLKAS